MRKILTAIFSAMLLTSCGIYSFSGTSIEPDVNTISIEYFQYKALTVNPTLSNDITEALKNRYRRMTRLEQVETDADMELTGEITNYVVSAQAITANEQAAKNRLTVTVKIEFVNNKHPETNVTQTFSEYSEFDSATSLASVESTVCAEIVEKLVEDIFNATVAQW